MAIERIQPAAGASPQWQPEGPKTADVKEVPKTAPATPAQTPAPANTLRKDQTAASGADAAKPEQRSSQRSMPSTIELTSARLKALQDQSQTEMRITSLDQTLAITRQELAKATHEQMANLPSDQTAMESSYWSGLDVVEKARTINQLKDRVRQLELERRTLVENASRQVESGTYRVTGAEILTGMLEEYS